ncbi:hypothetical protein D9M70_535320 [compost metagenome]
MGTKRLIDSEIEQLMFLREKLSEAAAKTATSSAPLFTAASKPSKLGTRTGNFVLSVFGKASITSL